MGYVCISLSLYILYAKTIQLIKCTFLEYNDYKQLTWLVHVYIKKIPYVNVQHRKKPRHFVFSDTCIDPRCLGGSHNSTSCWGGGHKKWVTSIPVFRAPLQEIMIWQSYKCPPHRYSLHSILKRGFITFRRMTPPVRMSYGSDFF